MNLHVGINQKTHLNSRHLILITVFLLLYINIGKAANFENHTVKTRIMNKFGYPGDTFPGIYNGSLSKSERENYGNVAFKVINNHRAKPSALLEFSQRNSFYISAGKSGESNATTAFFIAFVPGFFVHGLGHNYIGDKDTFKILLITEAISLPIIYYSAVASSAEGFEEGKDVPFADAALVISVSAFMLSWIYDFVGAPIKAEYAINESQPEKPFAYIPFDKNKEYTLKIVYSF